ncbi:Sec14p-like phosphatidylinositol transfer family protein [Striga hermonthica]|uniref:Sec14p-like phosphatidylinositol transfer family protein n=1 Tax=Striga hermonthica TaxID=68872 RepID=A0A9N7MIW7_STRHE|nr:Sec14p-like phosphatidylinositol transfer family protein [Striga hermonthica]
MDENQELALAQMRKLVQKLGYSSEGYGDPTLMRFLIARSLDTEKAANMFVQWQKWRASFVPLGSIPDSQVEDELCGEKIYLQGLSTKGTSVVIVKACKHYPSKDQPQFKSKMWLSLLTSLCANFSAIQGEEIGNEKLTVILDLEKLSYKNVDARGLITGFQFLQAYYPERLAKLYILHMPGFFVRVWRFVSRFLEKATQEKVVIVTSEDEKREFVKDIGEETLPEEYGGQAKLILIQDS